MNEKEILENSFFGELENQKKKGGFCDFKKVRNEEFIQNINNDFKKILLFFLTTHGLPIDVIQEMTNEGGWIGRALFCINFRKKYPKIVKGWNST